MSQSGVPTTYKPWLHGLSKKKFEQREAENQALRYQLAHQEQEKARQESESRDRERAARRLLAREQAERAQQADALQRQLQHEQDERTRVDFERLEAQRLEWERQKRLKAERKEREQRRRDNERMKLQIVSPDTLRNLRELIRQRYELDIEIWSLRKVRRPDRWIVEAKMDKADAILLKISTIVHAWDGTRGNWSDAEWKQALEIQKRVLADGKRWWAGNPPWED